MNTTKDSRVLHNRAMLGLTLMVVGLALYPVADAIIKHLVATYSVCQISFLRSFTRFLPLAVAVLAQGQGGISKVFVTNRYGLHAIRLTVNLVYTLLFMWVFRLGTLTSVYTLSYTAPFFMILFSALFLKEKISLVKWLAVAVGLFGIAVALQPTSGMLQFSALIVLFATSLGAINKILMRKLAETEHSLAIAITPNIVMMLGTAPFLVSLWQPMPLEHWIYFSIVGVLTAAGQYCITHALRFAQGSTLAPIDYSTFFWVVTLDFMWWDKIPSQETVLGAAIIVGSNLFIVYRTKQEQTLVKSSV